MTNPWDGRFSEAMADDLIAFNTSLPIEERLFPADIIATRAHLAMLRQVGLIDDAEAERLDAALASIEADWHAGRLRLDPRLEDIHMNLEHLLVERAGDAGHKVHTGRSRNDQQAVAQRIHFRLSTRQLADEIRQLQHALFRHCELHPHLMPSYTHLQRAEFTRYDHWLSSYIVMLERDRGRLLDALARADECPLGACASTGTSLPIDRHATAGALGFSRPTRHSIDSVSDRDYLIEFASAGALLLVHLSRLSEEIINFTSKEFGFLELPDRYATGSSIMPQKKNPDVLELIRGKAATAIGHANALLILCRSLPLGYNKDLQQDKTSWFAVFDDCLACVRILRGLVPNLLPVPEAMLSATNGGHIIATEYANALVRLGLPFRQAHRAVGRLVRLAETAGVDVADVAIPATDAELAPLLVLRANLTPAHAVHDKNSYGSCGDQALPRLFDELAALIGLER